MWTPESLLWDEARQWGPSWMSQITALNVSPCMWSTGRRTFQDLCSPERFVSTVQSAISLRILLIRIVQRNKTDRMCMCVCNTHTYTRTWGAVLPWWLSGKECTCQYRRRRFNPWIGRIPWRRSWQLTPVFLLGKSHGQRNLEGYSPWGGKRIGHDLATKQQQQVYRDRQTEGDKDRHTERKNLILRNWLMPLRNWLMALWILTHI